jgi:hypothetical protein
LRFKYDGCRLSPQLRHLLGNQETMLLVADVDGFTQPGNRIEATGGFLQQRAIRNQRQQGLGKVFA